MNRKFTSTHCALVCYENVEERRKRGAQDDTGKAAKGDQRVGG